MTSDEEPVFEVDVFNEAVTLIRNYYESLAKTVIEEIKLLPDESKQSGDPRMENVWEEYKYQLQGDRGPYFFAYEQTIETLCLAKIADLPPQLKTLLWLWSDECESAWWEEEVLDIGEYHEGKLATAIASVVADIAMNEELLFDPNDEVYRDNYDYEREIMRSQLENATEEENSEEPSGDE